MLVCLLHYNTSSELGYGDLIGQCAPKLGFSGIDKYAGEKNSACFYPAKPLEQAKTRRRSLKNMRASVINTYGVRSFEK